MKLKIKRSSTSKPLRIFIQDATSTTGAGLTGLLYNSAGLSWYYIREGDSSATAVTLVTATVGTYTSGGFKEVDATNLPGVYEIGPPNAALSSGASVQMMLKGATNMVPVLIEIELDAVDYQSATSFITAVNGIAQTGDSYARLGAAGAGLTALGDTRVANLDATVSSRSTYSGGAVASVTGAVGSVAGNVGGNLVGNVNGNVVGSVASVTGSVGSVTGTVTLAPATHTGAVIPTVTTLTNAPSDSSGVTTLLSRLTAARAGYLDVLNGIVAAIWAAAIDSSGVTTLLSRVTALRAGYIDKLNVTGTLANSDDAATYKADVTGLATGANVTTAANNVIAALPAAPDNDSISDIASTATKLENMIEADGPDYRYTTNALEQGASGAGGYTQDDRDAATEERQIINEIATDTADIAIIKARVLGMGGASITIQSPLLDAETIQLVRGTDYIAPFTQIGTWKVRGKDAFENHIDDFNLIIDADEPIIVPIVAQWVEITATKKELQFYASGLTADNTSLLSEKSNYPFRLVVDLDNDTVTEIGSGVVEMVAGGE